MKQILLSFVFVCLCVASAFSKGLPSYLELCHRKDPKINECILRNIEILRPRFKQGVPQLFIPPLDPLVVPEATLESGDNFRASFLNIRLYNIDQFQIKHLSVDLDKHKMELKIAFPKIRIKTTYTVKGRILILQLDGRGPSDGNYTNVEAEVAFAGTPFQKNGKDYIKWENEKIELDIGKPHLYFENIFGNNKELNEQTNRVINDNIEELVVELKPVIHRVILDFVLGIINRLFGRYSVGELFPNP